MAADSTLAEASLSESSKGRARRFSTLDITLGEILGKGSFGYVYRGAHPQLGAVAVKVLPWGPEDVSTEMKAELKLLQRCSSDFIVRAYGMVLKPTDLWIVMELCDLGSVLDVMRSLDEPLDEPAIAAACADSLHGLRYLHEQKHAIIHRDVKCANLLLSSAGFVKLADFGVAAQLNSTASKRSSVIGTPHWMAPEVIQSGRYGNRADVWSLGVTAIEMAQLRPPYHEMRPVLKVMFAIASGMPPQLDSPHNFSSSFQDFVAAALVKEASERPSAAALSEHPFIAGADRSHLLALVPRATFARANPIAKRGSSQTVEDSMHLEEETLRAEDPTSGANVDDNGTFIARPSAKTEGTGTGTGGTFCQRRTTSESGTGGTFCARRSAASAAGDGGTLRYSHGAAATPEHGHTLEEHRAEGTLGGGTFELPPGEKLSGAQPPRTVLEAWGGDTLGEPSLYATALEAAPPLGRSQSDDAIYATRSLSVKRKRLFASSSAGTLGGTLHRDSSPPLSRAQAASDDLVDCSRRTWHVEAREARGRTLTPAEDVQLDAASRCTIS